METRRKLIHKLKDIVNSQCNSNLSYQQVDFFIGEYMREEAIQVWIQETQLGINPVNKDMILARWENGYTFEA